MKKIILLFLLVFGYMASAQPKEEKIEYFTDYNVSRSIVSMQVHYTPGLSNRRVLSENYNMAGTFFRLQEGANLGFSQSVGGDFLFRLNSSLKFGLGLNWSSMNFTWDAVKFIDFNTGNGDTLGGEFLVKTAFNFLNIPIQFGFTSQVTDLWSLEVFPAVDLSFLQKLERSVTKDNPEIELDPNNFGNITDKGRQFNMAINFKVGGEYKLAERVGLFSHIQFRYFFFPLIESGAVTEIPYNVGLHTGLRFYF